MQLFSTRLRVTEELTDRRFAELFARWCEGSPYAENHIPGLDLSGEISGRWGSASTWVELQFYDTMNTFALRFQKVERDGSVWDTDFVLLSDEHYLYIQLHRSFVDESAFTQRTFSTPSIIGMLADEGYLATDDDLPVLKSYQSVGVEDVDLLTKIITGQTSYALPVVYITKPIRGEHRVPYREIAKRLKGVAHVLVEENSLLSAKLQQTCAGRNEHNGEIGIYYPLGLEEHRVLQTRQDPNGVAEKLCRSLIMYANALYVDPLCTYDGVTSARKDAEIQALQDLYLRNKSDGVELFEAYAHEVEMLQDQVKRLSSDLYAKDVEIEGLRRHREEHPSGVPLLVAGFEEEYFEGEHTEIVLAALADYVDMHPDKRRRCGVLRDVIEANDVSSASVLGERARMVEKIFKGYTILTESMRGQLKRMGIEVDSANHHYKLLYHGDKRYPMTVSKTPSDRRAGMNVAKKIIKDWL
ncbi:hypothetical protein [Alloscardovia macacae]|uniref:Uncharacterized protein n=1 Tax=Alloscardovia macacae TaxID=1160091 RepID=A0A261F459_9BIFI|nr:hypothetical protein [Alloscardovia macacae]OZG53894.1 hypothetical protein ALMA_1136 [Alloscardovia macacae]